MNRFWHRAKGFSRNLVNAGGTAAGAVLLGVTVLIDLELLVRALAGRTLYITEEYAGYGMAAIVFLGAGYALLSNEHIRVTLLSKRLKGSPGRWLELVVAVIGLGLGSLLLYAFFGYFMDSVQFRTRSFTVSRTPMMIPHGIVLLGLFLLWLGFLLNLIQSVTRREHDLHRVEQE